MTSTREAPQPGLTRSSCLIIASLALAALSGCIEMAEGQIETPSLDALKRSASCSVSPDPVAVGESYVVAATGLAKSSSASIEVADASGTKTTDLNADVNGEASLFGVATEEGPGKVTIFWVKRKQRHAVAACSFDAYAPGFCGDGQCDDVEDCIVCPGDCGACPPSPCTAEPSPVDHGTFPACAPTDSGGSCPLTCNSGYAKTGDAQCTNGSWSSPSCDPDPCTTQPPDPANGNYEACNPTSSGNTCTLTCSGAYVKSGDALCTAGTWSVEVCAMTGSSARCPDLEPIAGPSETLYVSPDGDDSASGDENAPLASLSEAASRFPSGGTVIVRGGVYPPEVWFRASGSAGSLLYIRAAEGETPIFDGSQVQDEWSAVIMMESASHVVFEGLEVRNCSAPSCQGIKVYGPVLDLTVRNCHIHHMDGPAARFAGKKIRIEGNDFHDIALTNVDNIAYPTGGWPTCTGTSPDRSNPSDPWADDVVIRANRIRDCWGEGIGLWYASNAIVQDNSIENAWNVGIYADNAFNLRIERNYVHMLRGLNGGAGKGILFGTEDYSGWGLAGARTSNVVTANNVVVAGTGIGWWAEQTEHSTYEAISLLHNTVVGTHRGALNFNEVKSSVDGPTDCVAKNNVFAGAEDSWLGNPDALEFGGNAWLNDPAPAFAGASDVSLEIPLGNWSNGVDARSIATQVGKGGAGAGVIDDFLCGPRDLDSPTRGAFE